MIDPEAVLPGDRLRKWRNRVLVEVFNRPTGSADQVVMVPGLAPDICGDVPRPLQALRKSGTDQHVQGPEDGRAPDVGMLLAYPFVELESRGLLTGLSQYRGDRNPLRCHPDARLLESLGSLNHTQMILLTPGGILKPMSNIFTPVLHPRIELRKKQGPVKVAEMLRGDSPPARFNRWLAVKVTNAVGTMWCAYAFAALALVSLPAAIASGNPVILVSWVSQTFLQLVLLSIIIVGQNVQAMASDKRAEATYQDADAVLHTALQIQSHLAAQDAEIEKILSRLQT